MTTLSGAPFVIENVLAGDTHIDFVSVDGRVLRIELEGDCCSSSFFDDNSKIDAEALLGERLMGIEEVGRDAPEVDQLKSQSESTLYHAMLLRTDKQSITVDWRNESNGHYDGWANVFLDGEHISGRAGVLWPVAP